MSDDDTRATEGLPSPLPAHALVRECRLTVVGGERDGTTWPFRGERTVVGAHPSADVEIADAAMSKFHCEIVIADGAPRVRDLGSTNGTFVDGVPIIEAPLRHESMLTLGRTQLRFDIGPRHIEIPLSQKERFGRLHGRSVAMRAAFALLERAAASDSTVLLQGETGTGKDLAGESIHQESARRDGPFVVVDCGALPPNLLEAELFGHERGAFTGATQQRIGAFEAAAGGTVLLDEIGELALDLQPKLLRVIERREVQRLGATQRLPVDVRIIAATNRNLKQEVNARRFRSDLYFRIAVIVVTLPPLRERTSDLPALVDAILGDLGARELPAAAALRSGELLPELTRHSWPGNVRELRNWVESCLVHDERAPAASASPTDQPAIDVAQPLRAVRDRWVRWVERRYLELLLAAHGNNVSAAARAAGIDRVHLHRLLSRAGLR
ncbi:MAG: sigma 54-interacting transcriptional regulator [Polyangia bacterium]